MRKAMVGAAGLALAATSVLFSSSTASAAPDWPFTWLQNVNSGKCVAIPASNVDNGTVAVQWTCPTTNEDQIWYAEWVPGGNGDQWRFINRHSKKCLAIGGSSTEIGAKAIQWTCTGNDDQIWVYDSIGRVRNVDTDRCLAVPNSSKANGAELVQWTCTENPDQRWNWLAS